MEEDHSHSECEEFMEDFFEPTLSKVKEVEDLRETSWMAVVLPTYNSVHVLESPPMDEAIGHRFGQTKRPQCLVQDLRSSHC